MHRYEDIKKAVRENLKLRIAMQDFWCHLKAAADLNVEDPEQKNICMRAALDCWTENR